MKLISGEEILTKMEKVDNKYKIKQPMMLVVHQQGLQMVPWLMLSSDETATIDERHVVATYEPRSEIVNGYQEQTSGIVTAPASALPPNPPNFR